jgi:hypothetical protein
MCAMSKSRGELPIGRNGGRCRPVVTAMALRLDPVVTATYLITMAAPVVAYSAIRLARLREHDRHRLIQSVLLVVCWVAVLSLEFRIRLGGGPGMFVDRANPGMVEWAHRLLNIHIAGAVATYLVWTWLVVASWRRYEAALPGTFSRRHRQLGTAVFGGMCFTAASASGIFAMVFVL